MRPIPLESVCLKSAVQRGHLLREFKGKWDMMSIHRSSDDFKKDVVTCHGTFI